MIHVPAALAKAAAQLGDPQILRVLFKSILLTLTIFVVIGALLWIGLSRLLIEQRVSLGAELGGIIAILVTILGGWLLFRIVALAVMQFFADEVILAVEERHYPALVANIRKLAFSEELSNSAKGALRALGANLLAAIVAIALLATAIGPAVVFWVVNAWLLGRELQDMVWLRHSHAPSLAAPLSKLERFVLGGAIAALLVVPFVNLLAPIIGAASATHLVHRRNEITNVQ